MFVTSKVSNIFVSTLSSIYVRRNDEVGEIQNMVWQCGLDVSKEIAQEICLNLA